VLIAAIFSGSIASLGVGLATYQLPVLLGGTDFTATLLTMPWGQEITGTQLAAVAVLLVLTLFNVSKTAYSAAIQTWTTVVPIAVLAVVSVIALIVADGGGSARAAPTIADIGPTALVLAYLPIYFAYSGWNAVIYVAGEVKDPGRQVPGALIGGTLAITMLYLLICVALLSVFGISGLREVGEAGSAAAQAVGGEDAARLMVWMIALSILGTLNGTILTGARVAYAMAQDGAFWSGAGKLHPRRQVPARALWIQAIWSCALVMSNGFDQIVNFVSVAMVLCGSLTVAAVFVLRHKRPNAPRPYRALGYPYLPALYLVSSLVVVVVMLERAVAGEEGGWYPIAGLGIGLAAYLVHRLGLVRRSRGS
jgi:APA family basic amino acid/polyamine antiporter